jgi:shikimate dehydrogenase
MRKLGLIGHLLEYSLSPKIHMAALDSCGLKGEYSLYPIAPGDQAGLKDLLDRVRNGEITGLNVTIPHKQNVIPLLDELTPTAQAIGAVNTISMHNGELVGDNTDAPGFHAALEKFLTTKARRYTDTKSALILGAGGSARAVVYALINAGWTITIASRRFEKVQALIAQLSTPNSRLTGIEYHPAAIHPLLPALSLILNTTPLGMFPDIDASPWPDKLPFPPNAAVYDLVYNPRETKLVKNAHSAGLPATSGLGMLIEQAALAFEIWTDHATSRDILWNAVEN